MKNKRTYRAWQLFEYLPEGWLLDSSIPSPLYHYTFCTTIKDDKEHVALVRTIPLTESVAVGQIWEDNVEQSLVSIKEVTQGYVIFTIVGINKVISSDLVTFTNNFSYITTETQLLNTTTGKYL